MIATAIKPVDNGYPWLNPIGGYGDMLMLSGVLKRAVEKDPEKRFNLIRRTNYLSMLKGHPAIAAIGFPPKGATILGVDYWSIEKLGPENQRPFQVLARAFGLETPVEERLYIAGDVDEDPFLHEFIPWKQQNVLIAPASDSPRKMFHPTIWHRLVDYLQADDILVLQAGRLREQRIRNAYSVLGLTTPRQLITLLSRCDIAVTVDNFIMHAAHLTGTRTVALWGPTHHRVYGYPEQVHLQMQKQCGLSDYEDCIGPARNEGGKLYGTPCPLGERHCIDRATPERIYEAVKNAFRLK